jgi:membrane-associated phospholipid phosphatase
MILYDQRRGGKPRNWFFSSLLTLSLLVGHAPEAVAVTISDETVVVTSSESAQSKDDSLKTHRRWYQGNLARAVAIPAVLIGYGLTVRGDHGLYSSVDLRNDIRRQVGSFHNPADNVLIFVPYAELAALALLRVPERHDRLNTSLLVLKSTAIAAGAFTAIKYATRTTRPDGSDRLSFPSGHTAIAFCAASLVHQEFRARSQWPGIGAYAVASTVGAFRMLNDRHWQSDVLVGAGIGILSVHTAYLTHRYRWGHRPEEGPGTVPPRIGDFRVSPWGWPGAGVGLSMAFSVR